MVTRHVIFLEEEFFQEGGMGNKIDLAEKGFFVPQIPDQIIEPGESSQVDHP